jgi:hypothetical protein
MLRSILSNLSIRYGERVFNSKLAVLALNRSYKLYESLRKIPSNVSYVTVFRGIPRDHPRYHLAYQGIVIPRNPFGSQNIDAHNYGSSKSAFTSWTRSKSVGITYAEPNGIVLEASLPGVRLMWSPDVWYENEVLVQGIVCGAKVHIIDSPPVSPSHPSL